MAQALINAQHQVNLAALPSFSDNVKEDKYTAAQWLQKVLLHRQAAAWTDDQIITHVRNALKDKVIDWFDALPSYGVSQNVWAQIQTRFEIDFEAKPTPTSIVAKLPEVKQAADENVNNYFNRANKILWELKTNIDPNILHIPEIILPDAEAAAWEDIAEASRNRIINHVRLHAVAKALECYNVLIITAGLKPSLKAKILGADLNNMAEIKDLALRTEKLEKERNAKTNSFAVNPVDEEDGVDAIYNGNRNNFNKSYRGGHSSQHRGGRGGYQPPRGSDTSRGGYSGTHKSKPQNGQNQAQQTTQPQRGGHSGQRGTNTSGGDQNTGKWCANCKRPTHNTAQCWTKKRVNPVEDEAQDQSQPQPDQNNDKETEFADAVHSFYSTKN
jgi:hypothetical protein